MDPLIEHGVEATTIEQVAKRAGVTRPTVYRRFPDKNQMLVAAIHMAHVGQQALPPMPECRDVEHMLSLWAQALCEPRRRRLIRRLMTSLHDYPDLREAYWNASIKHRNEWIRAVLGQARDRGDFPPDVNLEIIQQILRGGGGNTPHGVSRYEHGSGDRGVSPRRASADLLPQEPRVKRGEHVYAY